jgi:hypothetical protein
MEIITFNGQCPACKLQQVTIQMRYNICDELECPACNLRIYDDGKKLALIHRFRGKNEFALKPAPYFMSDRYFTGADLVYDTYTNGCLLLHEHDLINYINEVHTKAYVNSIEVLIDSYIDAFFNDKNVEHYYLISELVGIDISQTVFNSQQKSSIYLFQFMHFVIECYKSGAIESLEDFACTTQILDLKQPYIDDYIDVISNDTFLQKLALKNLIIAIINKIYEPKLVQKT